MKNKIIITAILLFVSFVFVYSYLYFKDDRKKYLKNDNTITDYDYIYNIKFEPNFQYNPILENFILKADCIIIGEVLDTEYIVYDGIPWTKLKILPDEYLYGEIDDEEYKYVYEIGGNLTYQEFIKEYGELVDDLPESGVIYVPYYQRQKHIIGEKSTLFLINTTNISPFDGNSYEMVCSSYSYLKYNSKNDTFKQMLEGDDFIEYRIEDVIKKIERIKGKGE